MTELQVGQVTVADLYRELVGMRADLSKVLTHQEAVDTRNQNADRIHADHEARLRMLEKFRYTLAGLSIIGGGISGWIGYLLGTHLH